VLFVFSILLTSKPGSNAEPLVSKKRWLGITAAVASVAVSVYALVAFFADKAANIMPLRVDMNAIGHALLGTEKFEYLLPFEAVSVLLLACIIGGIVIARKR
ncbi:MAG: NADH-quinone oxidoreductase subunit J, partial [Candidatus Limisoma sp.]